MKLKNLRPGPWEIAPPDRPSFIVDGVFALDAERERELAKLLLEQEDNYAPVDDDAHALLAELHAERDTEDTAGDLGSRLHDMKVSDVLPLLDALTPAELAEIRAAEEAGKNRQTVLVRIDELTDAASGGTTGGN